MIVNGTCINTTNGRVGATFVNVWTGLSSLVAVIWLGRSMYKQRAFSQPKFVALAVCFSDLMYSGKKIKMKNKKTLRNFFSGSYYLDFVHIPLITNNHSQKNLKHSLFLFFIPFNERNNFSSNFFENPRNFDLHLYTV